jgi:hypothetical protein
VSKEFSYSILQYKHSHFLGEVLNIGVLFIFPDQNLVEFHYPKKINRIRDLYGNFNESLIKEYLRGFEQISKIINKDIDKYVFGYNELLSDNFIIKDASSLQFGAFRSAIYYSDIETVRKQYIQLILGDYQSETSGTVHKLTEERLVRDLKTKVYDLNPIAKENLKFDQKRILRSNHLQFKSDFYWKNGDLNYTKAVVFELNKEETIINKALLLNGQLRQLEKSIHKNVHIDFVIGEANEKFKDAIEEATEILQENEIQKSIYSDWNKYSHYIADNISIF